jgi:hypothetical protein
MRISNNKQKILEEKESAYLYQAQVQLKFNILIKNLLRINFKTKLSLLFIYIFLSQYIFTEIIIFFITIMYFIFFDLS